MSKAYVSFYDWELSFKKTPKVEKKPVMKKVKVNSLGIPNSSFKSFLNEWKTKNL